MDADDALVHQHAETVKGAAATAFGIAQQTGAGRIEDDIGDDHRGLKAIGVEVESGGLIIEADGGGVDDDIGLGGQVKSGRPGEVASLGSGV